jgi:type VI protein secretion system component VasF
MVGLLASFYQLYSFIMQSKTQIDLSSDKEKTAIEIGHSYINKINQFREKIDSNIKESIKERFFYVMIGMYDGIMIQHLSKNYSIGSSFFDAHSLEIRTYNSAQFGDKFFIDVENSLKQDSDEKELLKVYLNILNIMFYKKNSKFESISRQVYNALYGKVQNKDFFNCDKVIRSNIQIFNRNYTYTYLILLSSFYLFSSSSIWLNNTNIIKEKIGLIDYSKI